MQTLSHYSEADRKFYEALGLLVSKEITVEKAAEMSGYSFKTFLEILNRKKIYPYLYDRRDLDMDLDYIDHIDSK